MNLLNWNTLKEKIKHIYYSRKLNYLAAKFKTAEDLRNSKFITDENRLMDDISATQLAALLKMKQKRTPSTEGLIHLDSGNRYLFIHRTDTDLYFKEGNKKYRDLKSYLAEIGYSGLPDELQGVPNLIKQGMREHTAYILTHITKGSVTVLHEPRTAFHCLLSNGKKDPFSLFFTQSVELAE